MPEAHEYHSWASNPIMPRRACGYPLSERTGVPQKQFPRVRQMAITRGEVTHFSNFEVQIIWKTPRQETPPQNFSRSARLRGRGTPAIPARLRSERASNLYYNSS